MKKVVLVSKYGYREEHDNLLRSLVARRIELFWVVGVECKRWHDIMDELIVGLGGECEWAPVTTWHENETVEEVVDFARTFQTKSLEHEVEVLEI